MTGNTNPLPSLERTEPANDTEPESLTPDARRPPRQQRRTAGALLVAGPMIFLLTEFIAAAAWTDPPYSYTYHFISDLGVHGPSTLFGQYMYSPLAWVMNTGFFLFGITILAGVAALRGLSGRRRWAALVPATLLAAGGVLLGLFPGSAEAMNDGTGDFHALGALAGFVGANVLAIVLGSMHRRVGLSPKLGRTLATAGVIGLVSTVAYFADVISGANILVGLVERGATHPFLLALACAGAALWGPIDSSART
ncbi:DUF998 domain-containing protein [Nonomuraea sp. NPDC048882]|uniref:DUF998 domain-containing protein n=1 Tax=Nonomuraea sp. NPDC048882 TaxID=3154347 RepID=UPI0033D348D0